MAVLLRACFLSSILSKTPQSSLSFLATRSHDVHVHANENVHVHVHVLTGICSGKGSNNCLFPALLRSCGEQIKECLN